MKVCVFPVVIPMEENIHADTASRQGILQDWHLHPDVFHRIISRFGLPQIDLFASTESHQLCRFFSWSSNDGVEVFNALSQRWDFHLAFVFLPISLIRRVLDKIHHATGTYILVMPFWESQIWFSSLLQLLQCRQFSDCRFTGSC